MQPKPQDVTLCFLEQNDKDCNFALSKGKASDEQLSHSAEDNRALNTILRRQSLTLNHLRKERL